MSTPPPSLSPERMLEILASRLSSGERLIRRKQEDFDRFLLDAERWLEENAVILKSLGQDPPVREAVTPLSTFRTIVGGEALRRRRELPRRVELDMRYLSALRYSVGITAGLDVEDAWAELPPPASEGRFSETQPPSIEGQEPKNAGAKTVAELEPRAELDSLTFETPAGSHDEQDEAAEQALNLDDHQDELDEAVGQELAREPPEREPGPALAPLLPIALASAASAALAGYEADAVEERDFVGIASTRSPT